MFIPFAFLKDTVPLVGAKIEKSDTTAVVFRVFFFAVLLKNIKTIDRNTLNAVFCFLDDVRESLGGDGCGRCEYISQSSRCPHVRAWSVWL